MLRFGQCKYLRKSSWQRQWETYHGALDRFSSRLQLKYQRCFSIRMELLQHKMDPLLLVDREEAHNLLFSTKRKFNFVHCVCVCLFEKLQLIDSQKKKTMWNVIGERNQNRPSEFFKDSSSDSERQNWRENKNHAGFRTPKSPGRIWLMYLNNNSISWRIWEERISTTQIQTKWKREWKFVVLLILWFSIQTESRVFFWLEKEENNYQAKKR